MTKRRSRRRKGADGAKDEKEQNKEKERLDPRNTVDRDASTRRIRSIKEEKKVKPWHPRRKEATTGVPRGSKRWRQRRRNKNGTRS